MTNYKLFELGMEEEMIERSDSLTEMVKLAITKSKENYHCTYRLESWIDYKPKYGHRFFEKGKDVTEEFRERILQGLGY